MEMIGKDPSIEIINKYKYWKDFNIMQHMLCMSVSRGIISKLCQTPNAQI